MIEEAVRASLPAHIAVDHHPVFSVDVMKGRGLQPGVDLDDLIDRS